MWPINRLKFTWRDCENNMQLHPQSDDFLERLQKNEKAFEPNPSFQPLVLSEAEKRALQVFDDQLLRGEPFYFALT